MFSDLLIIFLLILANGVFAAAEIALLTTKRVRLEILSSEGNSRAGQVLAAQEDPSRFLATVQIGITLVGTLASAFGGAEAVKWLTPLFEQVPWLAEYAQPAALGLVVLVIAYFSLVFGELVPKRLGLMYAERVSLTLVRPLNGLARLTSPLIRMLSISTEGILKLLGLRDKEEERTSEQEINLMLRRATQEGVIHPQEERFIQGVFEYGDLRIWQILTPRTDIVAIDVDTPVDETIRIARSAAYSRLPIFQDNLDQILGYVHVKDLLGVTPETGLRSLLKEVTFLPESLPVPKAFARLSRARQHLAMVLDEYGGTAGLITLEDILEVIVGEIDDEYSPFKTLLQQQEGGWFFPGDMPLAEVEDLLQIELGDETSYATLAGFILEELGDLPEPGAELTRQGYCFRIEEMDNLRIAKIAVSPEREKPNQAPGTPR